MKTLYKFISALLALTFAAQAQYYQSATVLTANTAANVAVGNLIIDSIQVNATSANTTTVKFFDSSTTTTNIITPAYISYTSYATNWPKVFTNEFNLVLTNVFAGQWTLATTNAAATNSLPAIVPTVVAGNGSVVNSTRINTLQGLTAVSDQNAIVIIKYRQNR